VNTDPNTSEPATPWAERPISQPRPYRRGQRVAIDWQHSENTATIYHDRSLETVIVATDHTHALLQLPRDSLRPL
jgi:hypothetical protein